MDWIGKIPLEWNVKNIGNYFNQVKNKNQELTEQNLLSLSYGKIIRKNIKASDGLLPENFSSYNIVKENDIVLRMTDLQNDKKSLRTGLVTEKGIITSAYITLTCKSNVLDVINSKFIHYQLYAFDINKGFYGMGSGVRQNVNFDDIKTIKIVVPSYEKQQQIVDFLDGTLEKIENIISDTQQSIEELKKYKRSLITELVTKGLDKDVDMKDSGIEWIGNIPANWNILKFGNVISIKSNLVNPDDYPNLQQVSPDDIEKDTGRLIKYKTVRESGVSSNNYYFYKDQILYSKIRPKLNKVVIAPFDGLCSADIYPINTTENREFLIYLMISHYFIHQISMVTADRVKMPKVNRNELSNLIIVLPNKSEQNQIVNYLNDKLSTINMIIKDKEQFISELEQYKKSLIYEYVTGKKQV